MPCDGPQRRLTRDCLWVGSGRSELKEGVSSSQSGSGMGHVGGAIGGEEMASPKKEGFLTEEQREVLKIAAQKAEVLSSSPKSPTKLVLSEIHTKGGGGGGGARSPSSGVRHLRRSHSGKPVRVKKGE
ncbi:hypothetical protein BHE74_00033048 [Ensete ventricosum]|nr:hypothetical protein BHE74_00033048 [Ensete ventricosum]